MDGQDRQDKREKDEPFILSILFIHVKRIDVNAPAKQGG